MQIMKFGGSSVGTPERVKQVMDIVHAAQTRHRNVIAVFSAFQGVTDQLIGTARMAAAGDKRYASHLRTLKNRHFAALKQLLPASQRGAGTAFVQARLDELSDVLHGVYYTREVTNRMMDYIMSFGELLSTSIIAEAMNARGVPCTFVDSRSLIKTDGTFGAAHVKYDLTYRNIRTFVRKNKGLLIACGFISSTTDNDTTTLGRGGSDFTASIYGAAVNAREIEIWTDVDGVNTADPRKVKDAQPIRTMTYSEAMEMSHFGAKVIHPPTMQPALKARIPIRIKNTFNPDFPGTLITSKSEKQDVPVKGISSIDDIALIRIQGSGLVGPAGIGRRIFSALASGSINVIMVTLASSEYSLCLAVAPGDAETARRLIDEELRLERYDGLIDEVSVERGLSVVAIVGEHMRRTPGIAGKLYQSLGRNGVNVIAIAQGSSELNISTVVQRKDETRALNAVHQAFFRPNIRTVNVFLLGVGTVGRALLDQIDRQTEELRNAQQIDVHVRAIANSRKMLFEEQRGTATHQIARLESSGEPMNVKRFITRVQEQRLPNSIIVDCTASDGTVREYERVLRSGISMVAANKRANAGTQDRYERLRLAAKASGARFYYETNVGAGLPVVGTIQDLILTGDTIRAIEGTLSGTLSFLFNSFTRGTTFSEIVRSARDRGFTEPDPREDLNGMDVARKLLILARECGYQMEMKDIRIHPAIPRRALRAHSASEFLKKLPALDTLMEKQREKAARRNTALRYIARVADGKAEVSVREVGPDHPAYSLTGSEVVIAITTRHYSEQPLVIRGPGAGADVTAAGVFADILRLAKEH